MRIKLGKLLGSSNALRELTEIKLAVQESLLVMSIAKRYDEQVRAFEELKGKKIAEIGGEVPVGDFTEIQKRELHDFVLEAFEAEVDMPDATIPISSVQGAISARTLMDLDWIIKTENV